MERPGAGLRPAWCKGKGKRHDEAERGCSSSLKSEPGVYGAASAPSSASAVTYG